MRWSTRMLALIVGIGMVITIGMFAAEYCNPTDVWFYRDILGLDIGTDCR